MARTAATHLHYVLVGTQELGAYTEREYTVEFRQGQVSWTVGRVVGGAGSWMALHVRAGWGELWGPAWTRRHTTREAAVRAMLLGEDWRYADTHADTHVDAMSGAAWAMHAARLGLTVPGVQYLPPRPATYDLAA